GIVTVETVDGADESRTRGKTTPATMTFSEKLACADCGISFPEVSPRMFSFNNPYGACPECGGIGSRDEIDPDRLVPNPARSLKDGALAPWAGRETSYFRQTLAVLAKRHRFSLETPWSELRRPVRDVILHGERDGGFEGVVKTLERRYRETSSEEARAEVAQFMTERPCPGCGGSRLRPESLGVKIAGRSIAEVGRQTIKEAAVFFDTLRRLRDIGNTVLVVEHDEETIRSADYVVDLGPGAGELGGHIVAVGTPDEIMANPDSLTGRYLARALAIPVPATRRKGSGHFITIHNPREHNLKGMAVKIPLDRKSTRLNSSHVAKSYAVFCFKNKNLPVSNH